MRGNSQQSKMQRITNQQDIEDGLSGLMRIDSTLKPIADEVNEIPLRLQEPGFPGLARIIIGQQVSRASADAINARFLKLIDPLTAQAYRDAGEAVWIEIGLSRPKQKAFDHLTSAIIEERFPIDELASLPAEEAFRKMTDIKGIGPWTAEVYLLFCAGHPDIFPAGDLALQEAVGQALNLGKRPGEKETRAIADKWSPHRGIAARLFWSYYKVIREGQGALPI